MQDLCSPRSHSSFEKEVCSPRSHSSFEKEVCFDILEDIGDDLPIKDYYHFVIINDLTSEMVDNIIKHIECYFYMLDIMGNYQGNDQRENILELFGAVDIKCIKWLHHNRREWFDVKSNKYQYNTMDMACLGKREIIEWFYQNGYVPTKHSIVYACIGGNIEILEWLHERGYVSDGLMLEAMYGACFSKHLEAAKWFNDHYYHKAYINARGRLMSIACQNGHIELIKYLDESGIDPFYRGDHESLSNLIEKLCSRGDIEIIKWVHEAHRECFDIINVLGYACGYGQLDMAKWLYENTDGVINTGVVQATSERGHFEVVKWLCEMNKDVKMDIKMDIKMDAIDSIRQLGHEEIARYLIDYTHNQKVYL